MEQAVTLIFLTVGVTMFIFAVLQITRRGKTRVSYSMSALFFSLGYIWLYYGLYRFNQLAAAPWLLYSDVAATFLAGPLVFDYTRNLVGRSQPSGVKRFLPFLPALAVVGFLILLRPFARVLGPRLSGPNPDHFRIPAIRVLNTLGDLVFFCYIAVSTLLVAGTYRAGSPRFRSRFRGVLIYYTDALFTFVLFFVSHALGSDNILGIAVLANGINSVYFFYLSYRYPEYTQKKVRLMPGDRKQPSPPAGVDVQRVLSELQKAIEVERLFRDPDLTLQSLSIRLGIQNHQLSQILNEYVGASFRIYINRRRVDEAKKLLADEPETSILDVAFTVGFNSRSSFNSAFTKETGRSPTDYRKKTLMS